MVAVGILGVGLIMVASIFPVAMSQHRDAVEGSSTLSLAHRAQALMETRFDPTINAPQGLWRPVTLGVLTPGTDSPWMALPGPALLAGGSWTNSQGYYNTINYLPPPGSVGPVLSNNGRHLGPQDILSDARAPLTDAQAEESAFRLEWFGFYRQFANSQVQFAAAVCRQKRTDTFASQELNDLSTTAGGRVAAFTIPTVDPNNLLAAPIISRLPLPWRVTVAVAASGSRRLSNAFPENVSPGVALATLAPVGSKILLTGWTYGSAPGPIMPSGRVLTVTAASGYEIEVLEDTSDLPQYNTGTGEWSFDVWVFPPVFNAGGFARKSPVLDWVMF